MTVLQAMALAVVALGGTAVVVARDPLRQAMVAGVFGLGLAALFLVLQAPDVSLSVLAVAPLALPVMILFALAKIREAERAKDRE